MGLIDQYSVAAIPIQMLFNSTDLGLATAFIWKVDASYFLITNYHNVSGLNPFTGKHVLSTAAEPDRLIVWFNVKDQLGNKAARELVLRDQEGSPLWLVHPKLKKSVDAVALPIENFSDVDMHAVNTLPPTDLAVPIGGEVFILGYPFGIGPLGLPIWKRGSIASEPDVADPYMLVDSASRQGMSGSPVILRSWNTHFMANGNVAMSGGARTKFIGIYSGRLATKDPFDAQLGIVWPAKLIDEIVAGGVRDS